MKGFPILAESSMEEGFLPLLTEESHSTFLGVEIDACIPVFANPLAIERKAFSEQAFPHPPGLLLSVSFASFFKKKNIKMLFNLLKLKCLF